MNERLYEESPWTADASHTRRLIAYELRLRRLRGSGEHRHVHVESGSGVEIVDESSLAGT